jgi:single-strand DNA-binding protein
MSACVLPQFRHGRLALQPPKGVPCAPTGRSGSARRTAPVYGGVATNTNQQGAAMNINKIICTGRLTKDPELKQLTADTSVCELRLAVDGMGRGRETGYINVSVFGAGGVAGAEHLAKGWLVAVDGRLDYREWDTEAGKRHDYTVIGNVEFLAASRAAEVDMAA